MAILQFLMANWDSVAVVILVAAVIIFLIVKKQWGLLDKILFALVTWAEREYGGGTGQLKLAEVIKAAYPNIPAIIRLFLTADMLVKLIEKALAQAKLRWEQNPALLNN
jgi:hypothetical protein